MRRRVAALAAACLIALRVAPAAADTWHVSPDGTGDFPDIRSAVIGAQDGDEILLADGTFTGAGNRMVDFYGKEISIRSQSGNAEACVVEFLSNHAFKMAAGEGPLATVENLTFRSTSPYLSTRAIELWGTSPTIRGVRFHALQAVRAVEGAAPRIEDSVLEDGASLLFMESELVMSGCVLEAGSLAHSMGQVRVFDTAVRLEDCRGNPEALWFESASIEIVDSEFRETVFALEYPGNETLIENSEFIDCQGVRLGGTDSNVVVRNSSFLGTQGYVGVWLAATALFESCEFRGGESGGVHLAGGDVSVRDCLVTGNRHSGLTSAGFVMYPTTLLVEDCTIAGNAGSHASPTALRIGQYATAEVRRTILWGDCAESGYAVGLRDGATATFDCVALDPALIEGIEAATFTGDLVTGDPLFCEPTACEDVPTIAGDWTLREDSPALLQPCGGMGGLGAGCEPISVESVSWGAIKALYH